MKKTLLIISILLFAVFTLNTVNAQIFSPANGATDVSVSPVLSITFDGEVELVSGKKLYIYGDDDDEAIVNITLSTSSGRPPTLTYHPFVSIDNNILTIDLSSINFEYDKSYSVFTENGAIKIDGEIWDGLYDPSYYTSIWSFTTEEMSEPPGVVSFFPENGAADVSVSPILLITFTDEVELVSGKKLYIYGDNDDEAIVNITLSTSSGRPPTLTYHPFVSIDNNILTIDLSSINFEYDKSYSVFTEEGAIKIGGQIWDGLYDPSYYTSIWSFTTEEELSSLSVVSFTPANGATDIPIIGNVLEIEFDDNIGLGSNKWIDIFIKGESSSRYYYRTNDPRISYNGKKLQIDISEISLFYGTEYYITLEDDFVLGYSGFSNNTTWAFKTETAPPTWSSGFPTVKQKASGFDFKAKGNVDGFVYYVITTNAVPPSITNILEGKNESGNEVMSATYPIEKDVVLNSEFINYASLNGDPYYWFHMVMTDSEKSKFSNVATLTIDRTSPTLGEGTRPVVGCTNFPVDGSIMLHFSKMIYNYNAETETLSTLTASSFSLKNGEISVPFTFSTDGAYVYMTPISPLDEDTEYSIIANNVADAYFNFIDGTLRTLKTVKINRWIGSKDANWADEANWDGAYVSGNNVIILAGKDYYPTVTSNIMVNDLTIEAGALLEHSSGTITVNGDLELLSSETTNATYMPLGGTLVVEGETRVYQSIKYQGDNDYRYLMGAPTSGANNYNIESGYMVRRYNNTTDSWTWIENDYFQPGVGYLVFADNDLVFPGAINSGDISVAITRTNGKGFGWNMLANPYTSGIDWLKVVDEELVENSYWIWIPSQRGYSSYNGAAELGTNGLTNEIPSNHGFAVKVLQEKTNGTFTFSPEAMVVNSSNFLKSSSKKSVDHIKLSLSGNNNTNQLAVAFIESATQGVDKYDTEILLGNDSSIEIYTLAGNEKLVINSLPKIDSEQDVSLGFRVLKTGSYKVAIDKNNTSFDNVQLTDLVEGNVVNLLEEDYVFNVNKAGTLINDRFQLTFPSSGVGTRLNSVPENNSVQIFVKDSQLNVLVNEIEECDYRLVDISGRIIRRGTLYNGENSIENLSKGAFIINIMTSDGLIFVKKLFIIE